jgi:hypothetical protein
MFFAGEADQKKSLESLVWFDSTVGKRKCE